MRLSNMALKEDPMSVANLQPPVLEEPRSDSSALAEGICQLLDDLDIMLTPVLMPDNDTTPGVVSGVSSVMGNLYVIHQRLEKLKKRIHI